MTPYTLTLFVHLASVAVLFMAFAIEWTAISFLGKANSAEEAQSWLRLARLGPLTNGPALLVAILSGGYLASLMKVFKEGWISASFIGIVVVALFGILINVPRMRAIRLAIPQGGEALFAALRSKALPMSVRMRTFTALSIVLMMTAKFSLSQSLLALLGGLAFGFVLSLPALTRQ